jgi:hypothetical protein
MQANQILTGLTAELGMPALLADWVALLKAPPTLTADLP